MASSKTILEKYITDIQKIKTLDGTGAKKDSFVLTGDGMSGNDAMSSEAYDDVVEDYIAHCEQQIELAYEYLESRNKFAARVDKNSKKLVQRADEVIEEICSETSSTAPNEFEKEDSIAKKNKKKGKVYGSSYYDDDYHYYRGSSKGTTYYASSYKAPNKDNPEFHVYVTEEDFATFSCHPEPIDDGFNTPYEASTVSKAYGHWRSENKEYAASAAVSTTPATTIISDAELDRLIDEHANTQYEATKEHSVDILPLFKTLADFEYNTAAFDAYIKGMTNDEFDMYVSQRDWNNGTICNSEWARVTDEQLEFVQQQWRRDSIDDEVGVIGTVNFASTSKVEDSPQDDLPYTTD